MRVILRDRNSLGRFTPFFDAVVVFDRRVEEE